MDKSFWPLAILMIIIISCAGPTSERPDGTYYGVLPCADCPGISYEIAFNTDSTFIEKRWYQGKSGAVLTQKGIYQIDNDGVITLTDESSPEVTKQLVLEPDTLRMLDRSGNLIQGDLASKYLLTKDKPETFKMKSPTYGSVMGFKATGDEPSWTIEIDFKNRISFQSLDNHDFNLSASVPQPVRPQDVNAVSYRAKTKNNGRLHITIFRQQCTDTMSGQTFDHKVRVAAQTGQMNDMVSYKGCGEYKGDYRLNDIWVLKSIDSNPIETDTKAPNLEFQLAEQKVYGFGGCNRINGEIELSAHTVEFKSVAATKQACQNMDLENRFLELIKNNQFNFIIADRKLTLKNDQTELVFRKVD